MSNPKQTMVRFSATQKTGEIVPFITSASPAIAQAASARTFTWEMLERQLTELAPTATQKALVRTLVSATRKQAPFKPTDLVLREVLCIASVLMDETFHPAMDGSEREEGGMT